MIYRPYGVWPVKNKYITHLADECKGLPSHPLVTMAESDYELVDKVQAEVISSTCIHLLENLHHLRQHDTEHKHVSVNV